VFQDELLCLGLVVILGICATDHELLAGRVTEWLDGRTRLYTMPFSAAFGVFFPDKRLREEHTTMWQLSFAVEDEAAAKRLLASSEDLKLKALSLCGDWHSPVPELLEDTFTDLISGYLVYDRQDFRYVLDNCKEVDLLDKVVFFGDAAHPMTPFKGQGSLLWKYIKLSLVKL
jgi:2-polyprenyl-6-methoxyphenol hydroxylase-like FAD-dependent oxidoreductase